MTLLLFRRRARFSVPYVTVRLQPTGFDTSLCSSSSILRAEVEFELVVDIVEHKFSKKVRLESKKTTFRSKSIHETNRPNKYRDDRGQKFL